MTPFTVEAVSTPVHDESGWLPLRRITDLVPGTLLIEDAGEPMLVMPVSASSAARAALFVEGVFKIVGVEFVSGSISPDDDCDTPPLLSPEAERQHEWAESIGRDPLPC